MPPSPTTHQTQSSAAPFARTPQIPNKINSFRNLHLPRTRASSHHFPPLPHHFRALSIDFLSHALTLDHFSPLSNPSKHKNYRITSPFPTRTGNTSALRFTFIKPMPSPINVHSSSPMPAESQHNPSALPPSSNLLVSLPHFSLVSSSPRFPSETTPTTLSRLK
jgi:hypothetical protein